MDDRSCRWLAASVAIISLPLAIASPLVALLGVDFNIEVLSDPMLGMTAGARGAVFWRWSLST